MRRVGRSIVMAVVFLAGCGQRGQTGGEAPKAQPNGAQADPPTNVLPANPASSSPLDDLPVSFSGVLPCADCEGIRTTLVLRADKAYFLRSTYLGKGPEAKNTYDDLGVWSLSADERTLVLRGGREAPEMYALRGTEVLRKLDVEGHEIVSKLNYDLQRAATAETFEPRVSMQGMFTYMADAARFRECITSMNLVVATEAEYVKLERAYTAARKAPGEELLVNLRGRIVRRPRMEGAGEEDALVVEEFLKVQPGATCGPMPATPMLEGTSWKLTRLGEQAVPPNANGDSPFLQLDAATHRLSGSGGCNRFLGSYVLDGASLKFGKVASTLMACTQGMEVEAKFSQALQATTRFDLRGQILDLYDASGNLVARFESQVGH